MKAVALNVIMAQSLNIATAESFNYQPGYAFTQWLTQMMYSGDSYFMAELKSIRRLFNIHTQAKNLLFHR